jgi:putative endonuclease
MPRGTLYVGVTSNLAQRIWQHKEKLVKGFTREYGLDRLVWFEVHDSIYQAITREKRIKRWRRLWKIKLVEEQNNEWRDLYPEILE